MFVPIGLTGFMLMFIFMGATPLFQGVMEEKYSGKYPSDPNAWTP